MFPVASTKPFELGIATTLDANSCSLGVKWALNKKKMEKLMFTIVSKETESLHNLKIERLK